MIVIIAEKPSLGRNIKESIGFMQNRNGYFENNEYIVTWVFGHLFSLCDIEDYEENPDYKWKIDNLPCFPDKFKFQLKKDKNKKIDSGVLKQFELIKTLINRDDVEAIVNAGDADREGEIIVRLCVEHALIKDKPMKRLWLPDQTPETIKEALNNLKDDKEYNNLANEGLARTYIDWLYGVNLTRYATLKTGVLLRVGRVIIPIVKAIYDRDMAIRNFIPEKYYGMSSKELTKGEEIELNSKEKFSKDEQAKVLEMCSLYNECEAKVIDKKTKKDILNPPKLFSLSKLQSLLGKKYKISMDQSLKIVQKLYEEGYLTYPRTNSEYLATTEKNKIKKIIEIINNVGYPVKFKDKKTIFDDSKIESHSALTPTYKIPDKTKLTKEELLIYTTVFKRFVAVFCSEECETVKTELKIKVGDKEEFTLKGNIILKQGWTKYEDNYEKNKILPNIEVGDIVNINFKPKEKETTPPRHYTIETLNNYLKNPFKEDKNKESDDDTDDYKAIFEGLELGTEATRTGIIENAINSKYILLKKDVYTILPDGEFLIESLKRMQINMDKYKTSEIGKALKKVYREEFEISDSIDLAKKEIEDVFKKKKKQIELDTDTGFYLDKIGLCPLCHKEVLRNRYGYGCTGYKDGCDFRINLVICGRVISKDNAILLLKTGKTSKIKGFISKNNKSFDAYLKLNNGKVEFSFDETGNIR